jgi:hypothetical protein
VEVDFRLDAGAHQRGQFVGKLVAGGVAVKFEIALGQGSQELYYIAFIDASVLEQSEDGVSIFDPSLTQEGSGAAREEVENESVADPVEPVSSGQPGVQPEGVAG